MSEHDPLTPFRGLQIHWKDGLPDDRLERSTIESTLVTAGLTSRYSAIKRLNDGDDKAAREEMARIEAEELQATLGTTVTAQGQIPPANSLATSAQLAEQLRGAQGGGTNLPEEGGPKPK